MTSIRSYISDINNSLKAVNLDGFFPPKYLFIKTQSITADFIKKDNTSNKMLYKSQGWLPLNCVIMEEVPVTTCNVNVYLCQKLLKSKYRIPQIFESRYGALVRQVTSIDFSNSYEPVFSAKLWTNTQKREFKSKKYYFIEDGYIFIPIPKGELSTPSIITMDIYPKSTKEVDIFNSIQDCGSCKPDEQICKSILDYDISLPLYLEDDVKKELVLQLLGSYEKLQKDEYPNLNQLDPTNQRDLRNGK